MSGQPCGCDPEAKHKCADHRIPVGALSVEEVAREFMEWRSRLVRGGFGHADQIEFLTRIKKLADTEGR